MITPIILAAIWLPRWTTRLRVRLAVIWLLMAAAQQDFAGDADWTAARTEVHFAYSKAMFVDVNENDAKAAMKVYTQNIGDENGIYVYDQPDLPDGTNAIARLLEQKKADVLILTAEEFFALEKLGLEGPLLLSKVQNAYTEDYLLLARTDSTISQVEDLTGRSLIVASDARNSLASAWLEVLCREHGLGPAAGVLARIAHHSKTTQVVLPVFFRKMDACIVTRAGWEVMCELNPQLKKQLRVIAVSPPLVPTLTCFRSGFTDSFKEKIIKAVDLSSVKPEFKQLMALFKTDSLVRQPLSALEGTRTFISTYQQLRAGTNQIKIAAAESGSAPGGSEGSAK